MRRRIRWLVGTLLLVVTFSSQAAIVSFSPTSTTVSGNETFTMDIVGTDFDMTVDGGGLDMSFTPGIVRVLGVDYDDIWELSVTPLIDNDAGTVSSIRFGSFEIIQGNFPIATVTMQAIAQGVGPLDLAVETDFPFGHNSTVIQVTTIPGSVQVVPEPAIGVLVLGGLLALVYARRYSNSRRA